MTGAFSEIHPPFAPQAAAVEANRCLFCFDAPCTNACPTHIDVPRFVKKIASGNLRGAALAILDANILGLSCSRVCPVEILCEGACVLERYNRQPIEIGRLQRHAMDDFYSRGARYPLAAPRRRARNLRVACIGGGPASLACVAELRRHAIAVTVFDNRAAPGGLNTYGVAQYKLRPEDSSREAEFIRSLGVDFVTAHIGASMSVAEIESQFDAVFLGVGLGPTLPLGIGGETLRGMTDALQFIAAYKTGIPAVGRRVVVIGGGNTAIDAAVAAKRLGAEEVRMLYRRGEREMPAFRFELDRARQAGVLFEWLTQPVAVVGRESVEAMECVRTQLGAPGAAGPCFPEPIAGSNFQILCDMAISSIGQSKLVSFLNQCRGVALHSGRVAVDPETGQTANPRYFAGGDCVNGGREVVDAAAEGKRAALGMLLFLGDSNG
ncbi:MAG: NAD(P)-dependent oxidoreductase [Bryobacteraceae bacterium]